MGETNIQSITPEMRETLRANAKERKDSQSYKQYISKEIVCLLGLEVYNRFGNSPSAPEHMAKQSLWCSLHHRRWN